MPTEREYINYKDFVESLDEATPSANDKAVFNDANGPKGSVFSAIATFVHDTFAAFVNALTAKTSFANGDKIPVVNGSMAAAMEADTLFNIIANKNFVNNSYVFNVPVVNLPEISLSDNSYTISFPDTTSTGGADANKLWIFSPSTDTIGIDYSSYLSGGKYEVTLAKNKTLVYKISTGELLVKTIWNTEYKGDYFLIAANSSGVLYGPLSDYFVSERLDSDEKSIANIEKEIATPRTYQIWNNSGFLYGKGITNYGYPVATNPVFGNKYSDFIAVKKGDIIIANTCISNEGFAIAFYSSQDFSSLVSGVLGRDNTRLDKYIYICPSDGYISGSTSTYAYPDALNATIQIKTPSVKGESYESSSTPAYEFLNYNQLEKVGEVLTKGASGTFDDYIVESPCVWYDPNVEKLVMIYTAYRNEHGTILSSVGYAFSDDGIEWTKQGKFYSPSGVADAPDENGITGPVMVFYGGKYYFFYIGLTGTGYEGGTKSLCLAIGTSIEDFVDNTATRKGTVIAPLGEGWTASWYAKQVYHPTFVRKDGLWYCFFNSLGNPNNKERTGFAVAENLEGPWNVNTKTLLNYIDESEVSVAQIVIDPSISKIDSYFILGYGFNVASINKFCDCWAFTESDNFPYGWQYGGVGVKPSESGFDCRMAHKPFYLKHSGRMYHYYTAVGDIGRCIGLIK